LFSHFPQSDIDIVAPDGTVRHRTKGLVDAKSVTLPDPSIVIQPGDEIRRRIPSGVEEAFEVVDPVFHERFHGIPAHYQIKVRKKGTFPSGQGGNYSLHVSGQNARVNIATAPVALNNIKIDRSAVGTINTGNVQTINASMTTLRDAGRDDVGAALGALTEAIMGEASFDDPQKNELIEQVAFLGEQATSSRENRKLGLIKAAFGAVAQGAASVTSVAAAWQAAAPILKSVFGL
jgi:hypothetical protein